ncbi:hypothetical protein M0812_28294 [Anaeramoeba flamelloides]|uniref:Uncharacterized protein n=1 Tax=Anaeramoeba flamelloides TaxID=1746091 RepID=A0AAV7Y7Q2_9EUKA|nr:hypothetical protein M0812_28294 [Anaeramoeba flamelloides]
MVDAYVCLFRLYLEELSLEGTPSVLVDEEVIPKPDELETISKEFGNKKTVLESVFKICQILPYSKPIPCLLRYGFSSDREIGDEALKAYQFQNDNSLTKMFESIKKEKPSVFRSQSDLRILFRYVLENVHDERAILWLINKDFTSSERVVTLKDSRILNLKEGYKIEQITDLFQGSLSMESTLVKLLMALLQSTQITDRTLAATLFGHFLKVPNCQLGPRFLPIMERMLFFEEFDLRNLCLQTLFDCFLINPHLLTIPIVSHEDSEAHNFLTIIPQFLFLGNLDIQWSTAVGMAKLLILHPTVSDIESSIKELIENWICNLVDRMFINFQPNGKGSKSKPKNNLKSKRKKSIKQIVSEKQLQIKNVENIIEEFFHSYQSVEYLANSVVYLIVENYPEQKNDEDLLKILKGKIDFLISKISDSKVHQLMIESVIINSDINRKEITHFLGW